MAKNIVEKILGAHLVEGELKLPVVVFQDEIRHNDLVRLTERIAV